MTTSSSLPSTNTHINTQTPIFLLSNISNYVTIKLDHSNYLMWKFQITGILDAYSLLDHLEDPTPCPPKFLFSHPETETQEVNPLYTQWRARDKALFSLISSTLSPSTISLVMGQTSASGIWKVLVNRYTSVSRSNIVNLKRELNSIKKNSDSVTDYLHKIKEVRNKLVSVGIHIDDEEILHIVLQGLPSEFHSFTSAMLTKNEAVKYEELHTLLKTEEDLLRSATENSKEIAHMAMVANKTSQPMYNNSSTTQFGGHRGRGRNHNRGRGGNRGQFQNYNNGRGGFSQGNFNNGGNFSNFTPNSPNPQSWDDSHRPNSPPWPLPHLRLHILTKPPGYQTRVPPIILHPISIISQTTKPIPIHSLSPLAMALNFPFLTQSNLLSVQKFCRDNGTSIYFDAHRFQIQDLLTGKPLYKGSSKDGLYPITGLSLPSWQSCVSQSQFSSKHPIQSQAALHASYTASLTQSDFSSTNLWHMRLGHSQHRVLHHERVNPPKRMRSSNHQSMAEKTINNNRNENTALLQGRYEINELLGQGSFAKVYHASNVISNESVAIKVMDKEKILKYGITRQIKHEIHSLRRVRHPNIVQIFEVMATKAKVYIVMEYVYVRGGELFKKVTKGRLKEQGARKYFQQLISAVGFCHFRGVFHRDLKPENLLLDENERVSSRKGRCIVLGIILFELMTGYLPFHGNNALALYKGEFRCPRWFSSELNHILSRLLDVNPKTRITIPEIMENKWFKKGFKRINFYVEDGQLCNVEDDLDVESESELESKRKSASLPRPRIFSEFDIGEESMSESESEFETPRKNNTSFPRPASLNAFDIISFSQGLDLSGLFEENGEEARFVSHAPVSKIISKLEEIGNVVNFIVRKKGCRVSLQGLRESVKGPLVITAEIFELTPSVVVVELKKNGGDSAEYEEFCYKVLIPGLQDLVQEESAIASYLSSYIE
uniref:non-specific serine/threonine protein kinase n=1 Tax=Fagus sylvatica TaxID=28930 RepID=A0A2N9H2J2_FAGSY